MSNNKMLIDATHPEETRVVVLRGGRVEEFDYESAARKLLRGNIYLAKVTRVEPALQAAFVDYGGNRHGFLAFNEIHPDYYQIPMADRQALLEEEAAAEAEEEAAADARAEALLRRSGRASAEGDPDDGVAPDDVHDEASLAGENASAVEGGGDVVRESAPPDEHAEDRRLSDGSREGATEMGAARRDDNGGAEAEAEGGVQEVDAGEAEPVEQVGSEDALEEAAARPRRRPRSYKIHEVIKRRQVILVQVVKEERGNKGAALTTYLSLAGRYTVLMPNTGRGGGISRKITNPQDRKRLKAIANELEVPEGMGLIIRTAGASRTKQEIKRDFEYLLRLWESVRELTLESSAPSLVYEEGNLIKRSIRDLYNKDVEDIVVAGEEAHREARDFMRMLMPSHAKNVFHYQEPEPLFTRFQIERQLNAMFSPYVTLRSGGYLVINQTEALVAVDVNSGKSTREFSIEETALNTNLEAAEEIARQLKLRDLAGLIVIDFIDMEEKRNNRSVERRLKDALRLDRARIQLGRISHFGLMEMSRQRLRTGVLEGSTSQCAHCQGTGIIRSTESVALAVLRGIEDELLAGAHTPLIATASSSVALYILNNKRSFVIDMEARHGLPIIVQGTDKMQGANFTIEKGAPAPHAPRHGDRGAVNMNWGFDGETAEDSVSRAAQPRDDGQEQGDGGARSAEYRRRGRRRRPHREEWTDQTRDARPDGGGAADESEEEFAGDLNGDPGDKLEIANALGDGEPDDVARAPGGDENAPRRGRRRGRRGGRRGRDRHGEPRDGEDMDSPGQLPLPPAEMRDLWAEPDGGPGEEPYAINGSDEAAAPEPTFSPTEPAGRDQQPEVEAPRGDGERPHSGGGEDDVSEEARVPARRARPRDSSGSPAEPRLERVLVKPGEAQSEAADAAKASEDAKPARKGWWLRRFEGA